MAWKGGEETCNHWMVGGSGFGFFIAMQEFRYLHPLDSLSRNVINEWTNYDIPIRQSLAPLIIQSLLQIQVPFPSSISLTSLPNHNLKRISQSPRRKRHKRAGPPLLERKVLSSDGLKDIHGHGTQTYTQQGRDRGGFQGAQLPEVVGA